MQQPLFVLYDNIKMATRTKEIRRKRNKRKG